MTKLLLKDAPLVLAIIQLEFSPLPILRPATPELLAALHACLAPLGFPEPIEIPLSQTIINVTPNTPQSLDLKNQQFSQHYRYLFRAPGERSMVEITDQRLILRATDYVQFEGFRDQFESILNAIIPVLGLNNTLLKRVSVRYSDLIVPTTNHTLDDFVDPDIRPASLSMLPPSQKQGINQVIALTGENQQLIVLFEEVLANEHQVHRLLPEDLYEIDPRAGLFINKQESWLTMTSPTYGILSIDHIHGYPQSPTFNKNIIMEKLDGLYSDCKKVFWNTITPIAKECWHIIEN